MGMGHAAAYADTVKEEFVKSQCPKQFKALEELISGIDKYELYSIVDDNGNGNTSLSDQEANDVIEVYEKLCKAFKRKTGLSLSCLYHDSQNEGDRYDDIDGFAWVVDGVYQYSHAGRKFRKHITRSSYVMFG